jgi:tight adherence protein B
MTVLPAIASAVLTAVLVAAVLDPSRVRRARREGPPASRVTRSSRWRVGGPWRRRRSVLGPSAVGAWADDIARSLRHGATVRAAVLAVVPDDDCLRTITASLRHRLDRGATVTDAADAWSEHLDGRRAGHRHLIAFGAVLGAAAQLGGSASVPLERFAATMRQHVSDDLERAAQSAQAKMSARVLTTVPLVMLTVLVATDADVRDVLAAPSGGGVVAAGLALNAVGAWWMRRIVAGAAAGARR